MEIRHKLASHVHPWGTALVAETGCEDRYATGVAGGEDIVGALGPAQRMDAWAHRGEVGTGTRRGKAGHTAGPHDCHDRDERFGLTKQRRWDENSDQHDPAGRRCCRRGPKKHSGHIPGVAGVRSATAGHGGFGHKEGRSLLNPRCLATRGSDAAGPEGHRALQKSSDGVMVDGGVKRRGNRGSSGCGVRSLVERLNQTVSIHPDMTDAPTHRNPGIHGFPIPKERRLVHRRSLPRPTESDPSRADLRGQSGC